MIKLAQTESMRNREDVGHGRTSPLAGHAFKYLGSSGIALTAEPVAVQSRSANPIMSGATLALNLFNLTLPEPCIFRNDDISRRG
jgi:hypothetical protein